MAVESGAPFAIDQRFDAAAAAGHILAASAALMVGVSAIAALPVANTGGISGAAFHGVGLLVLTTAIFGAGRRCVDAIAHHPMATAGVIAWSLLATTAAIGVSEPSLRLPLEGACVVWMLAAFEEIVFRVLLPGSFARMFSRMTGGARRQSFLGIVGAQILFVCCHLVPHAGSGRHPDCATLVNLFTSGLLLAQLARHALWAAIAAHAAFNVALTYGSLWPDPPRLAAALAWTVVAAALVAHDVWRSCPTPSSSKT